MGGNADMPCCAPMCDKVKKSGSSMATDSNTKSQGTGGGAGGGKFKTKHGVNAPMNDEKAIK